MGDSGKKPDAVASTTPSVDTPAARAVVQERLSSAAAAFHDEDAPPTGMNVVIIVIDTLRADRLGAYGYSKNTSPRIDAIAKEGTLFHRMYAASPWTAPSFGTLFTGVSPSVHMAGQVLNHSDPLAQKRTAQSLNGFSLYPLRPDVQTIAERLSCCVDTTAAIVSNPFLHPSLGFSRGFTLYSYSVTRRPAKEVSDLAIDWIAKHEQQQFFLTIHYMDTHQPYEPDEVYRSEFFPMDGGRLDIPVDKSFGELQRMKLRPNELSFLKGLYDAQIRNVDTQIGRVVDALQSARLLENSWLVITADHGEEHFDHGSFFHGLQYTDEVVRVPLIIRAPGGKWGAGNEVVYSACQQDVMPTILGWLGAGSSETVEGKSLIPLMTGEEKSDRSCYMEMSMLRDDRSSSIENTFRKRALFDGRYKAIQSLNGSDTQVFDLDNDPFERLSLAEEHPGYSKSIRSLHQRVAAQQNRMQNRTGEAVPASLPDDVSDALKNLGYVLP